jgi:hypothetical protein
MAHFQDEAARDLRSFEALGDLDEFTDAVSTPPGFTGHTGLLKSLTSSLSNFYLNQRDL